MSTTCEGGQRVTMETVHERKEALPIHWPCRR